MPPTGVWCAWWLGFCISNCCQFNYSSRSSSNRDARTSELGWGGPLSARVATWVVVCTLRSMRTALLLLRRTSSADLHSAASPLSSCQHLRSFHRYVHDRCYVQCGCGAFLQYSEKRRNSTISVDLIWLNKVVKSQFLLRAIRNIELSSQWYYIRRFLFSPYAFI